MSTPKAAFDLVQLFFVRSVVVSMPGHQPSQAVPIDIKNAIDVRRDDNDAKLFVCSMRTTSNAEQKAEHPYMIDMEAVCSLRQIDGDLDDATAHRGATITAHSVLYGAIREATSWLTSRQPWGQVQLGLSILTSNNAPGKEDPAPTAP